MNAVLTFLLHATGWTLAHVPLLARPVAALLGEILFLVMPRRRRTTLSNLDHAFPERGPQWARSVARASFRRMVETALFTAAMPYLSEASLRRRFSMPEETLSLIREVRASGAGCAIAIPHLALWEALSLTPLLAGVDGVRFGTVYRPQKLEAIENWIRQSRSRFGLDLFSKRSGLLAPARYVSGGGFLGVLIDQNAGEMGTLDLFLGRLASCTTLHGILAERAKGAALFAWPERTGFWSARLRFERLNVPIGADENAVVITANDRLARLLTEDAGACAAWLWSHNRWRCQDAPAQRFRLQAKRSLVHGEKPLRQMNPFPRKTRLVIVVGEHGGSAGALGEAVALIRRGRPDMELAIVGPAALVDPLRGRVENVEVSESRSWSAWSRHWRSSFPDCILFLDAPVAAAVAAKRAGVRQRLGVCSGAVARKLVDGPAGGFAVADAERRWPDLVMAFGAEGVAHAH